MRFPELPTETAGRRPAGGRPAAQPPAAGRSAAARRPPLFPPFTWRGGLFFFLSAGLLLLGIARRDLAALLWGSAFQLAILCAQLGGRLVRAQLRRRLSRQPDGLFLRLPARGMAPGERGEAGLQADLPRPALPGFRLRLLHVLDARLRGRPPIALAADLPPGRCERRIAFTAGRRGEYRSRRAALLVCDPLGFTRIAVPLPLGERLWVFPPLPETEPALLPPASGGESSAGGRRRRSEEPFEVRRYFPGDDPRRLHWKLYAHRAELYLRIGEESLPPRTRCLLVLDTAPTPLLPSGPAGAGLQADYLDRLAGAAAAAIQALLRRGRSVLLTTQGIGSPREFSGGELSAGGREEWLRLLAGLRWAEGPAQSSVPPLPDTLPGRGRAALPVFILASPGSPALEGILREIRRRGWPASLRLPDLPLPAAGRRWAGLWGLLLRQEAGGEPGTGGPRRRAAARRLSRAAVRRFRQAAAREAARFRAAPWGIVDVRPI